MAEDRSLAAESRAGRTETVQIAGSTRSLWEMPLNQACAQLQDLGFDKCELWVNDDYGQLTVADIVNNADNVVQELRESSRVSPVAICIDQEVTLEEFEKIIEISRTSELILDY